MKVNELSHMMQKPEPKPDTYEAGMALNQLLKIGTHAIKIHNMIDDHAEMESWVAKKIDLASNYVKSVHGYTAGSKAGTYDDDGMTENVDDPVAIDGKVVKKFATDNPDTKFILSKTSNGKFKVTYNMDINIGGVAKTGAQTKTVRGETNEFDNANDAIAAGKKKAADTYKDALVKSKQPPPEPTSFDLEDWSTGMVQEFGGDVIQLAKGQPIEMPGYDSYGFELDDGRPDDDEGNVAADDSIGGQVTSAIKMHRGNIEDNHDTVDPDKVKPNRETMEYAQAIIKNPEFKKAYQSTESLEARLEAKLSEDAGDEQKWMNYAKFWKFVNEIFKDKAEDDISDQFISATTVDEEPSYSMSKELMQRQLKKQNTPFKINIDADLDEFSNELNGRYEDETDMAKMKQAAIEIIKTGSTQIEPVKNAGTLSTYVQEDAGEGHMSKSQLYQTAKMAIELLDMINKGDDLEGWVQTKLNLAADYLQAVYHYEDYQKLNPYREEIDTALVHKHAGIIQKHLDEILARETETADVDTKPGMMKILKKRVNEVEKEIAKENRKETNEATIKPYVSMYRGKDGKMVYDVLDKHEKSAFKTSDERVARAYLSKNYDKLRESGILYRAGVKKYGKAGMKAIQSAAGKGASHQEIGKIKDKHLNDAEDLEEGIKEWGKRLAMAGVIVAGLAGINSINNAIDNSIPAVKAMNTALEMAQDSGNDELAKMIEKDLSDAKVRLTSGKDLEHVAGLQDKYAKFMKTEGLAYESKLAVSLKQRLK